MIFFFKKLKEIYTITVTKTSTTFFTGDKKKTGTRRKNTKKNYRGKISSLQNLKYDLPAEGLRFLTPFGGPTAS